MFYCGWASQRSFGARSWLIQRADGNVMVDVSRRSAPLARRIEEMGGLAQIVLTHRDDLAEHQRWAQAFASERWIHLGDADAAPSAEQVLEGQEPLELAPQMQLLPTPGHTPGSLCLLLGDQQHVLFSGDHVWWNCYQDVLVVPSATAGGISTCRSVRFSACNTSMWVGSCRAMAITSNFNLAPGLTR